MGIHSLIGASSWGQCEVPFSAGSQLRLVHGLALARSCGKAGNPWSENPTAALWTSLQNRLWLAAGLASGSLSVWASPTQRISKSYLSPSSGPISCLSFLKTNKAVLSVVQAAGRREWGF